MSHPGRWQEQPGEDGHLPDGSPTRPASGWEGHPGQAGQPGQPQQPQQPGQYGQPDQRPQADQYGQPGQHSQAGQYGQPGQHDQRGQYGQPGQYSQAGQYGQRPQTSQYGQPGQHDQRGQYGQAPRSGYPGHPGQPMTAGGTAGPGGPGTPGGTGRPASGGSSDLIAAGVNGVIALLVVLLAFLPVNTVTVPFYGMEIKGVQNGWGYTNVEATGSLDLKKMMEEELKGYLDEYGGDLFGGSGGDSDYGSSDYGFGSFSSHEFDSRDAVLTDGRDGDSTVDFLPAQDSLGDAFMDGLQQEFENQAGDIEQEIKNQAEAESTLSGGVFFFMLLIVLLFVAAAVLWALRLRLPAAIASIVGAAGLLGYCLMVIVGSQTNVAEGIDELKDMDVTYTQSLSAGVWLMILLALAAGAWGLFSLFRWPGALKNGGSSFALPGGFSLPGRQGGQQAGNRFGSTNPQGGAPSGNRFGSGAPQTGNRFGSGAPQTGAAGGGRFGSSGPHGDAPSGNRFGSVDPQTGNRFGSADRTGQQSDRFPTGPGNTAGRADQRSDGFTTGSGNHTDPTDAADSQTRSFRSWPGTGSQQSTPEHYRPQDNGPEQPGDHRG